MDLLPIMVLVQLAIALVFIAALAAFALSAAARNGDA